MTWYPHTVTVAATDDPLTLAEARAQVQLLDESEHDTVLNLYRATAKAHVEKYCGTPLASQTVTVKCDCFSDFKSFPVVPLTSVSSITYVDTDGATQTLATSVYEVRTDGLTASIVLKYDQEWPDIRERSRITVTAVVGYATIPADIKHAMLLLVGHWFKNREASGGGSPIPMGVDALLSNHRTFAGA